MGRRLLFGLLAAGLYSGCTSRQGLQAPGDAYSIGPGSITTEALVEAEMITHNDPDGPKAARARFILIRHAYAQNRLADMDYEIAQLEKLSAAGPWLPAAIYLKLLVTRKTEGHLRLLQHVEQAMQRFPGDQTFHGKVEDLIPLTLEACNQSDLETFLAESPGGPLVPKVTLALGTMHQQQGAAAEANRILRGLIAAYPDSPSTLTAASLIKELAHQIPTNARVIGTLLPTSGAHAAFGNSVLQGIQLAVEEFETRGESFEFEVMDTAENSEQALQSMDVLVRQKLVIALFGPLFSRTALVCAAEANSQGIVLLTPSALDTKLTETGPYVFRATLTQEQQAKSMARFAIEVQDFERFGILTPESAYGRNLSAAFAAEVTALGGTVVVESHYPPQITDFNEAIVAVGGANISAYKEADEEFRRAAQAELEVFLLKFFRAINTWPRPEASSTVMAGTSPADLPSVSKISCLMLTREPFTNELAQRLRAAALPHKTITVARPRSATGFSAYLTRADIQRTSQFASPEESALRDLLTRQDAVHHAPLTVLISVTPSSVTEEAEFLRCTMAMYDSRTADQLTMHRFISSRPLLPQGNRYELEALYIPTTGAKLIHIVPQLIYHNIGLPILGSDTWNDRALRKKPEAINLPAFFTVSFWPELDRPETVRFTQRYQERFAALPDSLSANAFDAAGLLMEAILRSDGTREGLRQQLANFGSFEGVSGPLIMTPQRDIAQEAIVLEINNGFVGPAE